MTQSLIAPLRYSLREAQTLLGLSRSTLYTRIAAGKLTVHKDGRRTFVLAAELDRYLATLNAPADAHRDARL
jgi:excisionase family DNA binding protein